LQFVLAALAITNGRKALFFKKALAKPVTRTNDFVALILEQRLDDADALERKRNCDLPRCDGLRGVRDDRKVAHRRIEVGHIDSTVCQQN
jgi:hypothetical protein